MSLKEITQEAENLFGELKNKVRNGTSGYRGNCGNYNSNLNRAIIGFAGGFAASFLSPIVGLAGLTYGGVKAYHAYKDKRTNVRRVEENGNHRAYREIRHTI